jgi:alkylation response protein AidB-like acyl-CoA dehydrogenase
MDFDLGDEQRQLQDGVGRFVRENYAFEAWRRTVTTEQGFRDEHWAQMAELGWLGVAVPEEFGGLGGSAIETMVIMEGFGRGLVAEPYLSTAVIGAGLMGAGSAAQKRAILPALVQGRRKLAFAFAEHQARFNLADVAVAARKEGAGWTISGRKIVVADAPSADTLIVTARTAGGQREAPGVGLFLVDRRAKGVELAASRTLDHRRAADATFTAAAAEALVAEHAMPVVERVIDRAISALAAEAVGAMQVLCDATNEYLKTRRQFGRPIGQFQVLQHRMVDMLIALEQGRSMSLALAAQLAAGESETARMAAATKAQIGQSGRFVGQQAVQLHGGMGMSDELDIGHYMKRLMMIDLLFGNADHHRRRFASLAA